MNFTVLPPTSPPRRRRTLLRLSCRVSSAANDQSGSADAAMTSTFTPSQSGALHGSLDVERRGGASASRRRPATALSGPVTESNGLRERIASALVACGLADAGARRRRCAASGGARELLLVGAEARADELHDPLRVEERRDRRRARG